MPPPADAKAANAFRTIGEVSSETGIAQHVLRYWERHFTQLRPITRAGNRRYYRPEDVALVVRIERLLAREGYTIRGVQRLFAAEGRTPPADPDVPIRAIRDRLKAALDADR